MLAVKMGYWTFRFENLLVIGFLDFGHSSAVNGSAAQDRGRPAAAAAAVEHLPAGLGALAGEKPGDTAFLKA